jgi:hypothetical protein
VGSLENGAAVQVISRLTVFSDRPRDWLHAPLVTFRIHRNKKRRALKAHAVFASSRSINQ